MAAASSSFPVKHPLDGEALDILFREARTYSYWLDKPVEDEKLRQIYELMKWGPTSANGCPARLLFLRTSEAKQRLVPALAAGNVQKTLTAPVTAIIAYDLRFFDKLSKLAPHVPAARAMFEKTPGLAETTAFRNGTLQGAYLILAARALGLDCGPMSGFDNKKVDEEFFGAGKHAHGCDQEFCPEAHIRSNFLCNIGYGDPSRLHPRAPRLDFEEVCSVL